MRDYPSNSEAVKEFCDREHVRCMLCLFYEALAGNTNAQVISMLQEDLVKYAGIIFRGKDLSFTRKIKILLKLYLPAQLLLLIRVAKGLLRGMFKNSHNEIREDGELVEDWLQ